MNIQLLYLLISTVDLARSHAKKISDIEAHKRERLQDRVEAFSSAFEDDVDYYKEHGHTDSEYFSLKSLTF